MSRFINIGGIYLNLDHVRVIIDHEDGTCTIITDDGERYTNVDTDGLDFEGRNIIRAVIPARVWPPTWSGMARRSIPPSSTCASWSPETYCLWRC